MPAIHSLLIAGGSGFVGQSLLDLLSGKKESELPKVIGLTSRSLPVSVPELLREKTQIKQIKCDLQDPWNFDFAATHIINLAADGTQSSYSDEASDAFMKITRNLGDWCKRQGRPRVFHASSGAVYAKCPHSMQSKLNKDKQLGVTSISTFSEAKRNFVRSRLDAELHLQELSKKEEIDLRIGRLFSFIGNHLINKPQYAINSFIDQAIKFGKIEILGNPNSIRGYLGAEEMAEWIFKSVLLESGNCILDIGSSKPVSMWDLANFVATLCDSDVEVLNADANLDYYLASNKDTLSMLDVTESSDWHQLVRDYLGVKTKTLEAL